MSLFDNLSGAEFSFCGKYRYALWRVWDESKPLVMFIGLNPSTANATSDDPTIRRVKAIAKNLGFGGVYMMNLFAFVSPYPEVLAKQENPLGDNNKWLIKIGQRCSMVIFAWGNFKIAEQRAKEVQAMFPVAYALHINKNGSPKHPLYCKSNSWPVIYGLMTTES